MKKRNLRYSVQLVLIVFSIHLRAQSQSQFLPSGNICNNSSYKLVFSDEFNGNALDQSKWTQYYPYGPNGSDQCSFCRTHSTIEKQEGQIYRDENVTVSNGTAKLTVKREAGTWFEFTKDFSS